MYSIRNLELAWMRIKTGQNIFYKNYYRSLFSVYELAKEQNLHTLHQRLKGGSYKPSESIKFYIPKPSGLHRPITFLHIDDLIVYQAIANIIAKKFSEQREQVEFTNVFSYVLNRNRRKDIFLFKKWQEGYIKFLKKIKYYFNSGNIWVGHFDLAAYYDTIDHYVLAKQISKNAYKNFTELLCACLEKWSSQKNNKLHHSIPQGPLASALIGEIYLLPIDKVLHRKKIKYVRYVDDIKIFGKSREEVLYGVIILEKECKERGLIPQTKKCEIVKASNLNEAIGKFPSLTNFEKRVLFSDQEEAYKLFVKAFNEDSFDISKVKYILKVSEKNDKILQMVLKNLSKHPELVDEFCQFLMNYIDSPKVAEKIYKKALENPSLYEYVDGKYWGLLSNFVIDNNVKNKYINIAIKRLIKSNKTAYSLKLGLYNFLCSTDNKLILSWLGNENSSLLQSFVVPNIPRKCIGSKEYIDLINKFAERSNYEPMLAAIKELILCSKVDLLKNLNMSNDPSGVVKNTLGKPEDIDSIGQILSRRYEINYTKKWRNLLDKDYKHANNILFLADKSYYIDRNSWVNYTDAFNEIIVRKFLDILKIQYPNVNWPVTIDRNNRNVDYGKLLDENNQFSKEFEKISDGFRIFHKRRSETPASHAYDKKTLKTTKLVTRKEQKLLFNLLKTTYSLFIIELEKL